MYRLALLYLICPKTLYEVILIFIFLKGRHWNNALNIFPEVEGFQLSINISFPIREIRLPLEKLYIRRNVLFERYDTDEN